MRQKPKLLLVVNDAGFFLSHRLPVAEAARAAGFDVGIATAPSSAVARIHALGFPHHPLPLSRSGSNPLAELRSLWSLIRLYRRLRPDVVHHVTIKPVLYGGLAARLTGIPAQVSAISGLGYLYARSNALSLRRLLVRGLYRLALRHKNGRVIFQNPDDRDVLKPTALGGRDVDVMIRGSGVDLEVFTPRPEPAGRPVVLMASRLLWQKGVGRFVEAARALRARGMAARFVLVGAPDGGNPDSVPLAALEGWQREGVIEWLGYRTDIPELFQQAHIIVFPSSYGEGVPKVLLEAAASGRPIVTTDAAGCREVVGDGEHGFLVPPGDVAGLAARIERLIEDPQLRRAMGARARARAEAEFSVQAVVQQHLRVYRELLAPGLLPEPGIEEPAVEAQPACKKAS